MLGIKIKSTKQYIKSKEFLKEIHKIHQQLCPEEKNNGTYNLFKQTNDHFN